MPAKKKAKRLTPEQLEEKEKQETLADAIIKMGQAVDRLGRSKLNKKAVVALIHDSTKLSKRTITQVIDSLPQLEKKYCKK